MIPSLDKLYIVIQKSNTEGLLEVFSAILVARGKTQTLWAGHFARHDKGNVLDLVVLFHSLVF